MKNLTFPTKSISQFPHLRSKFPSSNSPIYPPLSRVVSNVSSAIGRREMPRRSAARSWAIDCDISQQPPAPRHLEAGRTRGAGLAAIGRRWCHAVTPKSLISSAGFSAVHTDHSSGVAASSETFTHLWNIVRDRPHRASPWTGSSRAPATSCLPVPSSAPKVSPFLQMNRRLSSTS